MWEPKHRGSVYKGSVESTPATQTRTTPFGFGEYAETVGPQGLLFVLKVC